MEAQYPHHLIVRSAVHKRAVHERNTLGTKPVGKPLGWMRGQQGAWFVQLPGGIDLPTHPTMHGALCELIEVRKKGLPA